MSMVNGVAHGIEIYSLKLKDFLEKEKEINSRFLYIKNHKFLSLYRIIWNFFILPFKAKKNLVYSFSAHGSPFSYKQIITIHDLISFAYPEQHRFQYYYFKFLVPLLLRSSKKIVAISEFTKSEILKYYSVPEDKIEVIYNGANFLELSKNPEIDEELNRIVGKSPFFLVVGASYPHKNVENLLESIKLFKNTECKFVIIAKENKYGMFLRELTNILQLQDRVIFLKFVSDELLAKMYHDTICNIYISSYEGFGFPPLEAASVNTVSLVSDIPVMREVLKDNAIFVDSRSPEKIAGKLSEIYLGKTDIEAIKEKLPQLLENYTWEKSVKKIVELINETE